MNHSTDYEREFWNAMRGKAVTGDRIEKCRHKTTNSYQLPYEGNKRFAGLRDKENVLRRIATVISAPSGDHSAVTCDTEDLATWLGSKWPNYFDYADQFTRHRIECRQLGTMIRMSEDFANDAAFDVEDYLTKAFAKRIGRAEEDSFLNGDGVDKPTGILNSAEVGHTAAAITYDDVIRLYFSVDKEYRRNAVWLMNDETALALRTMKDDAGNYLWNQHDNTILSKQVIISEYMPSAAAGAAPVAFGDFSYFWIVDRLPFVMRPLREKFALHQQIAYLGFEFLDAKLIRPEAIKVLKITE